MWVAKARYDDAVIPIDICAIWNVSWRSTENRTGYDG